jgi:predicted RNase H-like nuclease (RuvC/YqgF family)
LAAKYLLNKSDKEIEDIKKELQNNKDADSIRDTAIQLLKLEVENSKQTSGKLEAQLSKMEEKFEKKLDAIFDRLNQGR